MQEQLTNITENKMENGPFFRRLDWSAFWTACVLSFIVYFYTLAPTVTLEDSGELAVAGDWLGVPHPPGYPLWSICSWLFARIFSFVTFRGQPNPAWSIGLFSVVCGSLASGITAMLICRSGSDMLKQSRNILERASHTLDAPICWIGGVVCSLLFAFSPVMWSQSVIVEVYSLNAFFLALIFLLSYKWMCRPKNETLYITAFIFGLGLTNYQVLLLAALPLVIIVALKDIKLLRDFVIAGVPLVILLAARGDVLHGAISHPLQASGFIYAFTNILILVMAYFLLPNGRTVATTILMAELGVAFYVYMPIVSDLRNPPMNWGYPRTWEGFKHAITRGQYEKIQTSHMFSLRFVEQIGSYFADLRFQFTLLAAPLGFLPFTLWQIKVQKRRINALYVAIGLSIAAIFFALIEKFIAPGTTALTSTYKTLFGFVIILMMVGITTIVINQLMEIFYMLTGKARKEKQRDLIMGFDNNFQQWALATMAGFLVMSVLLIVLANPKGDIQDNFIQKVKFISSHALFAFWIGYGLILGLASLDALLRNLPLTRKYVLSVALPAAFLLFLVPIHENAYNKELIRIYGGAEQNGHDFGWQFGNYQLRGADAVSEELEADEEPLPNPAFPPEMGLDAIFYGGTDPGRFVPTYMIYSARVREDVYLITQNALADGTYMSVMRDLYGDKIWIPDPTDSAKAFQRYVEEVQAGKRPRNAELKIENGRVQVSGALGVMEINGILAQMIFEHNNYRHAFYVEESYVIPWMYPYMTPHGLIMKINKNITSLTSEYVKNDMDFWDWYIRKLLGNRKFIRDIVARKSFSKLRSAIAGLYTSRNMANEAERAFQQARMLYPLSPEATFRLVQEICIPSQRWHYAAEILEEFGRQDPGNEKVPQLLGHIRNSETIVNRIIELEAKGRNAPMDINSALELADCYMKVRNRARFIEIMNSLIATPGIPAVYLFRSAQMLLGAGCIPEMDKALTLCVETMPSNIAPEALLEIYQMYAQASSPAKMMSIMQIYLERKPTDWRAWLDMSALQLQSQGQDQATRALENAIRIGGNEAIALIEQDPRFNSIRNAAISRTRNLIGIPDAPTRKLPMF